MVRRCCEATCSDAHLHRLIQFCRRRHTFVVTEEFDMLRIRLCCTPCTRQYKFVVMDAARVGSPFYGQTRRCGSADGNVLTSQAVQRGKCLTSTADGCHEEFSRLPQGGILQRCATEQWSSAGTHCCLCVRRSESIASLLNTTRPLIFLYIYTFKAIFIALQSQTLPEKSFCTIFCSAFQLCTSLGYGFVYPIVIFLHIILIVK